MNNIYKLTIWETRKSPMSDVYYFPKREEAERSIKAIEQGGKQVVLSEWSDEKKKYIKIYRSTIG